MGKNKRKHTALEEILERPWCYYCERDFDDLKILINHQKAKHYKCERCGRRLNTAGGLSVHMTQVHKESLASIENALPNRAGLDVEIFGMEGVPDDVRKSHEQRVIQNFAQAEAERRAATGNPAPGSSGDAAKKPKVEGTSDLKKRLAEHKAKKLAEEAAAAQNGAPTPGGLGETINSPSNFAPSISPSYQQQQPPFAPPNSAPFQAQPQQFVQQPAPYPQHSSPPPFAPQQQAFSPQGMPQYPNHQPFAPPQQFGPPGQGPPPHFQNGPPQFQNGPPPQFQPGPQFQGGPPMFQGGPPQQFPNGPPFQGGPPQFGAGSPGPFAQNQFQPPQHAAPPQFNSIPPRPGSLPQAPGLPQRPAVAAPQVNAQQMQQMHQGLQTPVRPQNASSPALPSPANEPQSAASAIKSPLEAADSTSANPAEQGAEIKTEKADAADGKKAKKEKDGKSMKLIYSDNETSPEEKMARMPRYAFAPAVAA